MKDLKRVALIILLFGGLIISVALIIFFYRFAQYELSNITQDWGVFGDYIGGVLNPIIGLMNFGLLIAISVFVAKFDSHRQFNEYRYLSYNELCKKFDDTENSSNQLDELIKFLEDFKFNNQFLFPKENNPIFNSLVDNLIERVKPVFTFKEDEEEKIRTGEIKEIPIPRQLGRQFEEYLSTVSQQETNETRMLREFSKAKRTLISFVQDVMIEGNTSKYK